VTDPRRVSTALGYAVAQGGPRVSTALVYAVHGENERRVSTALIYVVTPDEAAVVPDTPTVAVDQITQTTARLTGSAYSHPDSTAHQASQFLVLASGGAVLYDSGELGAVTQHTATGLPSDTAGLRPQARYQDTDDEWSEWGEGDPFATLAEPVPALSVTAITDTTAELRYDETTGGLVVEYQTALAADTEYADPIDDVMLDGGDRFARPLSGLTADTAYRSRARHHDGEDWSQWSEVEWATEATAPPEVTKSAFTFPAFGQPVRGATAELTWELDVGRSVVSIEIRRFDRDTGTWGAWQALTGATATGVVFDSTEEDGGSPIYPDGFYQARLTLDDDTVILHPGFWIDNANVIVYHDSFTPEDEVDFHNYRADTPLYYYPHEGHAASACVGGTSVRWNHHTLSAYGPMAPPGVLFNKGAKATATWIPIISGSGFQWDRCWPGEGLDFGLEMIASSDLSIRCGIRHDLLSSAVGPFPDPDDPHRFIGVGTGHLYLKAGPVVQPSHDFGGWFGFDEWRIAVPVGISWLQMRAGGGGPTDGCRVRPYHLALIVTETANPLEYRAIVIAEGPDAWSASGRWTEIIDETFTAPEDLGCGFTGFPTRSTPFSTYKSKSSIALRSFSAMVLDDDCVPPVPVPEIPEEVPEPEEPPEWEGEEGFEFCPMPGVHWFSLQSEDEEDTFSLYYAPFDEAGHGDADWQEIATGVPVGWYQWDARPLELEPGDYFVLIVLDAHPEDQVIVVYLDPRAGPRATYTVTPAARPGRPEPDCPPGGGRSIII
jgi:hypothetical protein